MPYKLKGNCVVKEGGETVKCHETHEKAVDHLRALYANVENSFVEMSMSIVKLSNKSGEMRWRSVNSDTDKDLFDESMSVELFNDMVRRINDNVPFPEEFKSAICEEGWCGGMPYISLAHYRSGGINKVNVPGEILSIYVDNKRLKSTGRMFDTPLGKAVYRSIEKDLVEKRNDKVRISIGFLDLEHSHGNKYTFVRKSVSDKCHLCSQGVKDKIYKKGVLVHLALTRIPANPRTDMEVEKSMTTKREDLESIIEDPEVLKGLELKSQAEVEELLVVKTDDYDEDDVAEDGKKKRKGKHGEEMDQKSGATADNTAAVAPVAPVAPAVATPVVAPVAEPPAVSAVTAEVTPLQKSLAEFEQSVLSVKSQGLVGDVALQKLQPAFDELAQVIRSEVTPKPVENGTPNIETTLRSLLSEMLPQIVAQSVAPIQAELSELRALKSTALPQKVEFVPEPRSLRVDLTQRAAIENVAKQGSFARLANTSVGLPENFVRQA